MARSSTTRVKGQPSLNPGGRPKVVGRVRQLALEQNEENIRTLIEIRDDPAAPHAVRLAAANSLLDRAVGKPGQTVKKTVTTVSRTPRDMAMAELEKAADEGDAKPSAH